MPVEDADARAFGQWLKRVGYFTVSTFDDPGWGAEEVVADWIWREASRRLAYAVPEADRPHVLAVENIGRDVDGWIIDTTAGRRVSVQIVDAAQQEIAERWREVRPDPQWTWPLRSLLGDEPGKEPTP
jgi:hypothetical protein